MTASPAGRPLWGNRWAAIAAIVMLAAGSGWWWRQQARVRWARDRALRLLREAERYIPIDPDLRRLKGFIAMLVRIGS